MQGVSEARSVSYDYAGKDRRPYTFFKNRILGRRTSSEHSRVVLTSIVGLKEEIGGWVSGQSIARSCTLNDHQRSNGRMSTCGIRKREFNQIPGQSIARGVEVLTGILLFAFLLRWLWDNRSVPGRSIFRVFRSCASGSIHE